MKKIVIYLFVLIVAFSCNEEDILSPEITLTDPNDTIRNVLNASYVELGFSATDNVDGDISDRVFVKNNVNIDLVGFYEIVYKVVDEAGNEAISKKRIVEVYNQSRALQGLYNASNTIIYPVSEIINYKTEIFADTTINKRLYFSYFANTLQLPVYIFQSNDAIIELPMQNHILDTAFYTFSGAGLVSVNKIEIDYIKQLEGTTFLSKIICEKSLSKR